MRFKQFLKENKMAVLKPFDFPDDHYPNDNSHFESLEKLFEKILPNINPPDQKTGIPDFNEEYTTQFGSFNQILIYGSNFFGKKYQSFVIFDEDKKAKSFVTLYVEPEIVDSVERTKVVRSWTRNDSRRQGLVTTIYQFLVKKLNLKLICDDTLTQDSIGVYKGFIEKKVFDKISYYNDKTKEVQDETPDNLWTMSTDWRILLEEHIYRSPPLYGMPIYRQLAEYKFHLDEGLE